MPRSHPEYERGFRDGFEAAKSDTRKCVKCEAALPAAQPENYRYCQRCYDKRAKEWENLQRGIGRY